MTPGWRRATHYMLFTAALAWPLDLLQYIPWIGLSVLGLAALFLTAALVVDLSSGGRFGVPFEILAPAAVLAILVGVDALSHGSVAHRDAGAALLLLVVTTHFARTRASIRSYVWASAVGGMVGASLSVVTPFLNLVPTAFSSESGVTLTFATSLTAGFHILALCALCAIYVSANPTYLPVQRAVATGGVVLFGLVLVGRAVHWLRDTGRIFVTEYPDLPPAAVAGLVVTVWLVARVLAKVEVDRREHAERAHWLWWGTGIATLLVLACGPLDPRPYHGLVLGFMAGYALPERARVPALRWPALASGVVGILVLVNLFAVFPENTRDQRQYDAIAQRAYERGDFAQLLRHMAAIDRHAPHERRTHLWRAYTGLAVGLPNWASYEYAAAVQSPSGGMLLEAPSRLERQDFVVLMRDAAASMPDEAAVCAYERVLVASGERESALFSLQLETGIPLTHAGLASSGPIAAMAAMVLGAPEVEADLAQWEADELLTLLVRWGAVLEPPPPVFAPFDRPILFAAQRDLDSLVVRVQIGEAVYTSRHPLARVSAGGLDALISAKALAWSDPVADGESGRVRLRLEVRGEDRARPLGTANIGRDGTVRFTLADEPPVTPFRPGLLLYVGG